MSTLYTPLSHLYTPLMPSSTCIESARRVAAPRSGQLGSVFRVLVQRQRITDRRPTTRHPTSSDPALSKNPSSSEICSPQNPKFPPSTDGATSPNVLR
jgi:hypothetical protein